MVVNGLISHRNRLGLLFRPQLITCHGLSAMAGYQLTFCQDALPQRERGGGGGGGSRYTEVIVEKGLYLGEPVKPISDVRQRNPKKC